MHIITKYITKKEKIYVDEVKAEEVNICRKKHSFVNTYYVILDSEQTELKKRKEGYANSTSNYLCFFKTCNLSESDVFKCVLKL